ncbi:WSC domain-containing protein [Dendryphion nanum]|uniref:WSC domain-containing protein n=1 Tax=Dendryphion nanum TaxID=256645 RepID=A0A9P9DDQ6_9PLEO|nr:WSC domain-containing protein [Dendryphion nanum]
MRYFQVSVLLSIVTSVTVSASAIPHVPRQMDEFDMLEDLPSTWQFAGCWSDDTDKRVLGREFYFDTEAMTADSCVRFCMSKGYTFAGTEYGSQCFCDLELSPTAQWYPTEMCSMPCSGDRNQTCGGAWKISVYNSKRPGPGTNAGSDGYKSIGCFQDWITPRVLAYPVPVEGGPQAMTVSKCMSACRARGYVLAGLEYGGECWCDNRMQTGPKNMLGDTGLNGCDMLCHGNFSEYCGGPSRLNIYRSMSQTLLPSVAATPAPGTTTSADSAPPTVGSMPPDTSMMSSDASNQPPAPVMTPTPDATFTVASDTPMPNMSSTSTFASNPPMSSQSSTSTVASNVSTSSTTLTTRPPAPSEVLTNGDFENSTSGWTIVPNMNIPNTAFLAGAWTSTPLARNGSGAYTFSTTLLPSNNYQRSLCITQSVTFGRSGTYQITSYIGRIIPSGAQAGTTADSITYTIYYDNINFLAGRVCDPRLTNSCPYAAVNGNYVYDDIWSAIPIPKTAVGTWHNITICATFDSVRALEFQDRFVVDSVSLFGPGRGG